MATRADTRVAIHVATAADIAEVTATRAAEAATAEAAEAQLQAVLLQLRHAMRTEPRTPTLEDRLSSQAVSLLRRIKAETSASK